MALYQRGEVWWYEFLFAGRRVRESAKTTRKSIAREAERRRRLELEKTLVGMPIEKRESRINRVQDVVRDYSEHYGINHRPKSVIFSKQRLAHVLRLLGGTLLPDLTEQEVRRYVQSRLDEGAGGRTINMELGELSRAIGRTWRELWPKVRKLEERGDVGRALSPEEEARLLNCAATDDSPNRNPVLFTFLKIALTTGMRAGEIASLRWSQVDFGENVLTVGQAKTRSGSGRAIPMNRDLRAALEIHLSWYAAKMQRLGYGEVQPEWFVFPGKAGRPVKGMTRPLDPTRHVDSLKSSWEALRTKAGVSCRFHDLRHTAATKMAEAGVPESTMLALMGHMSRAMLERYSHVRLKAKREAVEALNLPSEGSNWDGVPTKLPTVGQIATIH